MCTASGNSYLLPKKLQLEQIVKPQGTLMCTASGNSYLLPKKLQLE